MGIVGSVGSVGSDFLRLGPPCDILYHDTIHRFFRNRCADLIIREVLVMARKQLQTLSEPMFFILLALTKPMHGYEIMRTVAVISQERVKVGAGTLYALLTRFEDGGFIVQVSDDGRRKTYELTEAGRELLDREYARVKTLVAAYVRRVLLHEE